MKKIKTKKPAATPAGTMPHTDVPDQPGDYLSRWNGARLKTILSPNPGTKTKQTHRLALPELCPASHNPLPGSTMLVFYKTRKRFLEVFSLSAYIKAAIGHPIVRDVEALTQAVALDCAGALGQKVYVEGRYQLRGLDQEVICIVKAYPPRKGKGKGKKTTGRRDAALTAIPASNTAAAPTSPAAIAARLKAALPTRATAAAAASTPAASARTAGKAGTSKPGPAPARQRMAPASRAARATTGTSNSSATASPRPTAATSPRGRRTATPDGVSTTANKPAAARQSAPRKAPASEGAPRRPPAASATAIDAVTPAGSATKPVTSNAPATGSTPTASGASTPATTGTTPQGS